MMTFKERDHWMRRMMGDAELTAADRLVGARVGMYLRVDTGELNPKIECLVAALGLCHRTVISALGNLVRRGWLLRERNGQFKTNAYALTLPSGAKYAPDKMQDFAPDRRAENAPEPGAKYAPPLKRSEEEEKKTIERVPARAGARASFSELDYASSDGVLVVKSEEIDDLAVDFQDIKDMRAAIRQADRWAMAKGIAPAERKAVLMALLRKEAARQGNAAIEREDKARERREATARKAEDRARREAERKERKTRLDAIRAAQAAEKVEWEPTM